MSLVDVLEFYFADRWRDDEATGSIVPEVVYRAIRESLVGDYAPDIIHPLDFPDNRIAMLMLDDEEALSVTASPPSEASVTFVGSLVGGTYTESTRLSEAPPVRIEVVCTYAHERLETVGGAMTIADPAVRRLIDRGTYPGEAAAYERTQELRRTFRRWSSAAGSTEARSNG